MDRTVLEAVAELRVREGWSPAARAKALEARRAKAHGILRGIGKVTARGPVLDVTPHEKDSFGFAKDPWRIVPDGSAVHVMKPDGAHHSTHQTVEDAANAIKTDHFDRRQAASAIASPSTTARARSAGAHNRRLHRGGH